MSPYPALAVFLAIASCALAHSRYRQRIPNGNRVPNPCEEGAIWGGVGHQSPAGADARNLFGLDFASAGHVWTTELCRKDSDGDGLTNGQELGDPDCVWTVGATPARTSGLSHPGICPFDSPNCTNSWNVCPKTFNCWTMSDANVVERRFTINDSTPVPAKKTSYICQAFDLRTAAPVHLIGSRPVVVNKKASRRIALLACDERPEQRIFDSPMECNWSVERCVEMITFWDGSQELDCFNSSAGFLVGGSGGIQFAVLQIQWANPGRRSGLTDASGFSLYFTSHLRAYHMGTQLFGELNLVLPPRHQTVRVAHTCPSVCTSFYHAETRYITAASIRMHSYGVRGRVSLWRNGAFVQDLFPMQAYNANSQRVLRFSPPVKYLLGDEVRTECYYSTAGSDVSIFRGYGRNDEMCTSSLSYYPNDVSVGMSAKLARCMALSGMNLCWLQSGVTPQVEQGCNITAMMNGQTPSQVLSEMTASFCFNRTGCDPVCRGYLNGTLWPSNACYNPRKARQMAETMALGKFVADSSVALKIASTLFGQRFCEQEINARQQGESSTDQPKFCSFALTPEQLMVVIVTCSSLGALVLVAALAACAVKIRGTAHAPYEKIQ